MGNGDGPAPYAAQNAAEFIQEMRRLKERSGLTYRQLEEKAAAQGDTLPRSTLANALSGRSLPRPELLAAFVRACGAGDRVTEWTAARHHLTTKAATEPTTEAAPDAPPPPGPGTPSPHPGTRKSLGTALRTAPRPAVLSAAAAAAAVLVVPAVLAIWALTAPAPFGGPAPGAASALPEGPVRIHPLSAPTLCLTDGPVPDGRYDSVVAVQRSCAAVGTQRTTLAPAGGGTYRIQWYRPEMGKGCLAVRTEGPATGLLEPQNDCAGATRLHVETVAGETAALHTADTPAYRFRVVGGRHCVAINAPATTEGTEAVVAPCKATKPQLFRITSAPPRA